MTRRLSVVAILTTSLLAGAIALAHGAVHERIATLTLEIRAHPNDAELLAKRGELHALDQNWTQAAEDFEEALAVDPDRIDVMHHLADAKLHLGDAADALRLANAVLARRADHPRALVLRARAHERLGSWRDAVGDMSRLIASRRSPSPENYVERAQIQQRGGDEDGAIAGLREGMARLGPLVSLVEPAVAIEARRGRHDAALALVDQLDRGLASTPRWLTRQGELHQDAGRRDEAKAAYEAALGALDRLVESRRSAPRQVELRARIVERLEQLPPARTTHASAPGRWAWWPALGAILAGAALGFALQRR